MFDRLHSNLVQDLNSIRGRALQSGPQFWIASSSWYGNRAALSRAKPHVPKTVQI